MAGVMNAVFGRGRSAFMPAASSDDFADFATVVSPSAPVHAATSALSEASQTAVARSASSFFGGPSFNTAGRPYTKWYRVWERTTLADFSQELFIIPVLLVIVLVHMLGARANRDRAKKWAAAHLPILKSEFAQIGSSSKVAEEGAASTEAPDALFKELGKNVFTIYATGRQNIAFVDLKLSLYKRYNPFAWAGELILSFFFDSIAAPVERFEATAYTFDGKEKQLVSGASAGKDSSYDGFVWAVVHKDKMRQLREDRYDLSLTSTKEHAKLPDWATIMSESAEVTEALLTPELIKAVSDAGDNFEALIVSDQPIDAPKKLDDTVPRKRVGLSMRLDSSPSSTALLQVFLRLPDQLVSVGHFRPEAMRRVRATREEEQRRLRKIVEDEKIEERRTQSDKLKKEERDRKLARMSASEQKKFLDKEREADQRKGMKKRTMRG